METKISDLEQQLIQSQEKELDNVDYDLAFVFKLEQKSKETKVKYQEVQKMKVDIFKTNRDKLTLFQKFTIKMKKKFKVKFKVWDQLREDFYQILINKCKLEVKRVTSEQHVIFKVTANEEVLEKEANRVSYKLRMKNTVDNEMAKDCPPYAKVEYNIYSQKNKKELFQEYYDGKTHFRQVDRIRLISSIIGRYVVVSQAQKYNLFTSVIPKNPEIEKKLAEKMVTLNPFVKLPIEDIRDYFGEQVALYFCWVEHFYK